jgi:Ca-activated chloride channel family protein
METTALTFGAPERLWFILLLPALAFLFAWSQRRSRALIEKIVAPRLRLQLAGSVSPFRRNLRAGLLLASLALGIVAIAMPRLGFIERESKQKGRDVIVAIDTSRSMLATDVAPDRLKRAKLFTQDLVRLLQGDRVGLVAFAGSAFLQAPLTLDYSAVTNSLEELDTNIIPKGGTNLAAAIATAREAFGKAEGQTRALVILTDGEELDADGIAAAKQAAQEGIRIFTVGIGSPEGSLISIRTEDGRQDFVRDSSGKPVNSKLDAPRLMEIATATGGFYVPIGPEAAREIFQKGIEPMELSENGVFTARQPVERFQWPLVLAVACLMLSSLPGDRRKRLPKAAALVVALLAATHAARADSPGVVDYNNGQFEKAEQIFENTLKAQPNSRELEFNAGAAAYKLGKFEPAITHFSKALLSDDKKMRENASYNLANALVRKGEAAKENDAKKSAWTSSIEHYDETLKLNPSNNLAKENRDLVKKMLEDLNKQEQQQKDQQKDNKDQNQDQKQDQKDKQDQQNKDNQSKDQKDKDQKNKDQKDKNDQSKDQQNKDQKENQDQKDQKQDSQSGQDKKDEKKDSSGKEDPSKKDDKGNPDSKNQDKQNNPSKSGEKPEPVPSPTPGEKKQGDLKSSKPEPNDQKPESKEAQEAAAAEQQEKDGQMSPAQARALLNSLRNEEDKVNLMQQQTSQEVLRDW